jgi:hypothetical protein
MEMENHTVEALLDIIRAENLADAVDLAAWGHNDLFLTEKEAATAEGDLNSAKAAGVNVKSVEILDKQMMNEVSIFMLVFSPPHCLMFDFSRGMERHIQATVFHHIIFGL